MGVARFVQLLVHNGGVVLAVSLLGCGPFALSGRAEAVRTAFKEVRFGAVRARRIVVCRGDDTRRSDG